MFVGPPAQAEQGVSSLLLRPDPIVTETQRDNSRNASEQLALNTEENGMGKERMASASGKRKQAKGPVPNGKSQVATGGEVHQIAGGAHPPLTTNQGVALSDNQNSLRANPRGPTLLEDFHLREKITHFDHERIPERMVHARGSGAHGYFQVYEPMTEYTSAKFLQNPDKKTPVVVRFSTVVGFRGSADTVRDIRGFAVKFYTEEGNYDLVGNNIPVFFIQD